MKFKIKFLMFFLFVVFPLLVSAQNDTPITLESIEINFSEEWCLEEENFIEIRGFDNNKSLVVLDRINITSDLNFTSIQIFKEGNFYKAYFLANFTEEGGGNLSILADQNGKIINQTIEIQFKKCGGFRDFMKDMLISLDSFITNYWYWFVFGILVLVLVIVVFIIINFKKEKVYII